MNTNSKKSILITAIASVANVGLGLSKLWVGIVSNYISVLTDGINNLCDVFSCVGAGVGIVFANSKPSKKYPNGLGKVEYLTTIFISLILLALGGVFVYYSVERLLYPRIVSFLWTYFVVLSVSVAVKIVLAALFYIGYKSTGSQVLKAEMYDSLLDTGVTSMVLVGFGVGMVSKIPMDGILGVFIGCGILLAGGKMFFESVTKLVGRKNFETEKLVLDCLENSDIVGRIFDINIYDLGEKRKHAYVKVEFKDFQADKVETLKKTMLEENININFLIEEQSNEN